MVSQSLRTYISEIKIKIIALGISWIIFLNCLSSNAFSTIFGIFYLQLQLTDNFSIDLVESLESLEEIECPNIVAIFSPQIIIPFLLEQVA